MIDNNQPSQKSFSSIRHLIPWGLIGSLFLLPSIAVSAQCQNRVCTIIGTDRSDHLVGTAGNDVICGLQGHDTIYGGAGDDLICGGSGNDEIHGESGLDSLIGGSGRDQLFGGDHDDVLDGNQGNDMLAGNDGDDFLDGGDGKDDLNGGGGENLCDTDSRDRIANCPNLSPAKAEGGQFTTVGHRIIDPAGNEFVPRGVNIFPWHRSPTTADAIQSCWGFNLVRLHAWIFPYANSQWKDHVVYANEPILFDPDSIDLTAYDVGTLIDYYTSRGIVVVFDVHENIGGFIEGQELTDYLIFVRDLVSQYKDNPYLWLDLHNEPGSLEGQSADFTRWRNEMSTILDEVRRVDPNKVLLVSGAAWGQDTGPVWSSAPVVSSQSALLSNSDLITRHPNVLPTFHVYDQWTFGRERLHDFVSRLYALTSRPVVIGEYGSINNNSTIGASEVLHWLAYQPGFTGLGRVVWTWDAYDSNDLTTQQDGGGQYVDSCTEPTNLTPLGQLVWNDNH